MWVALERVDAGEGSWSDVARLVQLAEKALAELDAYDMQEYLRWVRAADAVFQAQRTNV